MMPAARAAVGLVTGGTPMFHPDMGNLPRYPDMPSAAAELYVSSIALAKFLHTVLLTSTRRWDLE